MFVKRSSSLFRKGFNVDLNLGIPNPDLERQKLDVLSHMRILTFNIYICAHAFSFFSAVINTEPKQTGGEECVYLA